MDACDFQISEEMALVVQQHQQLQDAASKRERLGQTMRQRLEERCHKLEATNRQLTGMSQVLHVVRLLVIN